MAMDPTVIALIGTVMGGVGLKVAESWLGRNKVRVDDAARMRDELRLQVTALREENKALEAQVDEWRAKYYEVYEKLLNVQTAAKLQGLKIEE